MNLRYMIPTLKQKSFFPKQLFLYPDGKHCFNVKKSNDNLFYIIHRCYEIDLFTGNGMLTFIPSSLGEVGLMSQADLLVLMERDNVDFYPFWVCAIDRLVRFCGYNVKEAIAYQLNEPRQKLYDFINMKQIEVCPLSANRANRSFTSP